MQKNKENLWQAFQFIIFKSITWFILLALLILLSIMNVKMNISILNRHGDMEIKLIGFYLPTKIQVWNSVSVLLTYCCSAVLQTAMTAAMKPFVLTLTSVTVQTATPAKTKIILSFVSLEYRTLSKTTSRRHDTGIIVSLAIWQFHFNGKNYYKCLSFHTVQNLILNQKTKFYLIETDGVPH